MILFPCSAIAFATSSEAVKICCYYSIFSEGKVQSTISSKARKSKVKIETIRITVLIHPATKILSP